MRKLGKLIQYHSSRRYIPNSNSLMKEHFFSVDYKKYVSAQLSVTELNINGLPLEGSSTTQLKFWLAQGGLLHSYNKRQEKLLGSNQVFDKSKRRIKWRGRYFFGQVWWFEQGTAKTLVGKICSLSDSNWISVSSTWTQVGYNVISAFTLDSGERVLVNRWDRQALWNILWSADIFQQGMGASELRQCQHQAGGSGGVGLILFYVLY